MTAVGRVRLHRGYVTGADSRFPADRVLGVDGYLTAAARRMAVLAGVRQSFAKAEQLLSALSGWELDDDTIRQATHAAARQAAATRPQRPDAGRFAEAAGALEVPLDAGKVNTTEGWRDVKVAVFAKREPGEPATPAEWAERALPAPTARTVVAAIEEARAFATRVRAEANRLGVTAATDVTVLGDGAEWVWNLAAEVVPQAAGVLDIYHAAEHVAGAARAVWGEGTEAMAAQLDAGRSALLRGGKTGLERWLGEAFGAVPAGAATEPLLALAAYFAKHPTRLGYAGRWARGAEYPQRSGGEEYQAVAQPAAEANRGAWAGGTRGSARGTDRPGGLLRLAPLLDRGLNPAKFHRDTRRRSRASCPRREAYTGCWCSERGRWPRRACG